MSGVVAHLSVSGGHTFSKPNVDEVEVVAGIGIVGDAHAGAQVQHRSRVRADPSQPNLRQVHLMPTELFDDLATSGFDVVPGGLGENVTTTGIDLHALPTGSVLALGTDVLLGVTGLRNPCGQINGYAEGLRQAVMVGPDGEPRWRAGIMSVVLRGGVVRVGDPIGVTEPPEPHHPLVRV